MELEDTDTDPSTNKVSIIHCFSSIFMKFPSGATAIQCYWTHHKTHAPEIADFIYCCSGQVLTSASHSISSFFSADDWEYHQSAERYFRNLINVSESTVYRRILAPCLMITAFSALVAFYNSFALPSKQPPSILGIKPLANLSTHEAAPSSYIPGARTA